MKKVISHSLKETEKFAREWLASITPLPDEACVVGLYGNLGSGKTTLTQSVANILGVTDTVTSPTFVIEKIYEIKHTHFARLIHIDAYRIESARELQDLNFEKLVDNSRNLILIEWPENVKEILPENHTKIHCEFIDENTRTFEVQ